MVYHKSIFLLANISVSISTILLLVCIHLAFTFWEKNNFQDILVPCQIYLIDHLLLAVNNFLKKDSPTYVISCAIWYHWYNLKNVKNNTHGGVLLLVKKQDEACNFTKSNAPSWVFSRFLNCTNSTKSRNAPHMSDHYGLAEASKCTIESYPVTISKML